MPGFGKQGNGTGRQVQTQVTDGESMLRTTLEMLLSAFAGAAGGSLVAGMALAVTPPSVAVAAGIVIALVATAGLGHFLGQQHEADRHL